MVDTPPDEGGAVGLDAPTIDPFALHVAFARGVRGASFRLSWFGFLDAIREPIDVRADKILDLDAFGQNAQLIIKPPRKMRDDEYPADLEDRIKNDCERQFILRNIARVEKEAWPNDKLEFDHKPVDAGGFEFPKLASMQEAYEPPELLDEVSYQIVHGASRWRHTLLAVMEWERHFCREIRDKFDGPLWKYDPDVNPVDLTTPTDPDGGDGSDG
jgi:hypothetical protein